MSAVARTAERGFDRLLFALAAALCLGATAGAALVERQFALERMQRTAEEILAEDRAVCGRLQAPPDSALFRACVVELDHVREHARQRSEAADPDAF